MGSSPTIQWKIHDMPGEKKTHIKAPTSVQTCTNTGTDCEIQKQTRIQSWMNLTAMDAWRMHNSILPTSVFPLSFFLLTKAAIILWKRLKPSQHRSNYQRLKIQEQDWQEEKNWERRPETQEDTNVKRHKTRGDRNTRWHKLEETKRRGDTKTRQKIEETQNSRRHKTRGDIKHEETHTRGKQARRQRRAFMTTDLEGINKCHLFLEGESGVNVKEGKKNEKRETGEEGRKQKKSRLSNEMETGNWGEAFWQRRKDGDNANKKVIKMNTWLKNGALWNEMILTSQLKRAKKTKLKNFHQ